MALQTRASIFTVTYVGFRASIFDKCWYSSVSKCSMLLHTDVSGRTLSTIDAKLIEPY